MPHYRRSTRSLGLALLALATASAVHAQSDPKPALQARYTVLDAAMAAHDAAALSTVLTADFTSTDVRGETRTAAQMLERGGPGGGRGGHHAADAHPAPDPAKPAPAPPERKTEATVLSATISGDTALVHQQTHMAMTREGDDGEKHAMDIVILADDTWVHKGDVWLLQRSVQKDLTVKRDGEELFHQAADGS